MRSFQLIALFLLGTVACASPPPEDTAETATSDLTAAEHDVELRDAIHSANPSRPELRCSRGRGDTRMTFDVLWSTTSPALVVEARYRGLDYNAAWSTKERTEISAPLSQATVSVSDGAHRAFDFTIGAEPATLDAFGTSGSTLRFRGRAYKVSCEAFDF
jgi:hypothetical protein